MGSFYPQHLHKHPTYKLRVQFHEQFAFQKSALQCNQMFAAVYFSQFYSILFTYSCMRSIKSAYLPEVLSLCSIRYIFSKDTFKWVRSSVCQCMSEKDLAIFWHLFLPLLSLTSDLPRFLGS